MKKKFFWLSSLIALILVMVLSLTSCSEVGQARGAIEDMFDLLKQGKYIEARE